VHVARAKNNVAENAGDEQPITVTRGRASDWRIGRSPPLSRSHSPPCRSTRLAPRIDPSIDREGRTRAARRATEQARLGTTLNRVVLRHVANAQPIHINTTQEDYPVTSTGWGGIRDQPSAEQREYSILELRSMGMHVVEWDGKYVF
jgi:hypothetical protein